MYYSIFLICQGLLLRRAKEIQKKRKSSLEQVAVAAAKTGQDDCG